jgi:hypothetical protein
MNDDVVGVGFADLCSADAGPWADPACSIRAEAFSRSGYLEQPARCLERRRV